MQSECNLKHENSYVPGATMGVPEVVLLSSSFLPHLQSICPRNSVHPMHDVSHLPINVSRTSEIPAGYGGFPSSTIRNMAVIAGKSM